VDLDAGGVKKGADRQRGEPQQGFAGVLDDTANGIEQDKPQFLGPGGVEFLG
jgi:hypothetical protein